MIIKKMKNRLTITMLRFLNAHAHLRIGPLMDAVIRWSDIFMYVVVMGNTDPNITDGKDVKNYRKEIRLRNAKFKPIFTVMLTKDMTIKKLRSAYRAGAKVLKLIPANTSTGSSSRGIGLHELKNYYHILREIKRLGMIFSVHCELIADPITGKTIHPLLREKMGMPYVISVIKDIPGIKIIFEHASTRALIEFVKSAGPNVALTLTVHHAIFTYNLAFFKNGKLKNPFFHCLPCLKKADDRDAVQEAMISGSPKFFLGLDDAPHFLEDKIGPEKRAGIFIPGYIAVSTLIEIFEKNCALDKLENFAVKFGAKFYGLSLKGWGKFTMVKKTAVLPKIVNGIVLVRKKIAWSPEEIYLQTVVRQSLLKK